MFRRGLNSGLCLCTEGRGDSIFPVYSCKCFSHQSNGDFFLMISHMPKTHFKLYRLSETAEGVVLQ